MEPAHVQLAVQRRPLPAGVDPRDPAARRAWACRRAERGFVQAGALEERVDALGETQLLSASFDVFGDGDAPRAAATWRTLAQLDTIVCAFRVGEVELRDGRERRRAVCVMELVAGTPDRWWLVYRFAGEPRGRVGIFHGDWVEAEGAGFTGLDPALVAWLDTEGAEVGLAGDDSRPVEPDIRAATFDLLDTVPEDAEEIATLVERGLRPEVLKHGLSCVLVFAFRGRQADRWEIRGQLPCGLDDAVRNLTTYSNAEAVAVVRMDETEVDGETLPAVVTVAEHGGERFERTMPIHTDTEGEPTAPSSFGHSPPTVAAGERWIGVAPRVDLGLHMLSEDWGGGPIPEG